MCKVVDTGAEYAIETFAFRKMIPASLFSAIQQNRSIFEFVVYAFL